MKDKAMSLLNGLCSWLSSLGIAASIVVALFLGLLCCEGAGNAFYELRLILLIAGGSYAVRLYLSHLERRQRHPAHLVIERLIFCIPSVLLALFLYPHRFEWTYEPPSFVNGLILLFLFSAFIALPWALLGRTLLLIHRGEVGSDPSGETPAPFAY